MEEWTKKELLNECQALGLSDKDNRAVRIERIKEDRNTTTTFENYFEVSDADNGVEDISVMDSSVTYDFVECKKSTSKYVNCDSAAAEPNAPTETNYVPDANNTT